MRISIIIPTFMRHDKLERAILSVIKQTIPKWELIIVDDNEPESDGRKQTESMVAQYSNIGGIKYIKHSQNLGGCAARNTGIKAATGEYIAFLDDDDEWTPLFLEKVAEKLAFVESKTDKPFVVYCDYYLACNDLIFYPSNGCRIHEGYVYPKIAQGWSPASTSLVVVKKICFEKTGFFDERLRSFQDYDMWLRLSQKYPFYHLNEKVLIKHQFEGNQISINPDTRLAGFEALFEKWSGKLKSEIGEIALDEMKKRHMTIIHTNYMIKYIEKNSRLDALRHLKQIGKLMGPISKDFLKGWLRVIWGNRVFCYAREFKWRRSRVALK